MLKLVFVTPESHKEIIKTALFARGAGRFKNYDYCAFETKGFGQFKPSTESQPFIGEANKLSIVEEYKVEVVLDKKDLPGIIDALVLAHPYEEPFYEVYEMMSGSSIEKRDA